MTTAEMLECKGCGVKFETEVLACCIITCPSCGEGNKSGTCDA